MLADSAADFDDAARRLRRAAGAPAGEPADPAARAREVDLLWEIKDAESTDAINAICERRLKELGAWD